MNKAKSYLRKIKFAVGKEPKITDLGSRGYIRSFIPKQFKAVLLICADFELAWAWRYAKGFDDPYGEAMRHAGIARKNIPEILDLCEQYRIPITWATVGHLFLEGCRRNGHRAHSQMRRIPYHENDYWRYDRGDWFDDDPCTDWRKSPAWYAPDLIRSILSCSVRHEIACHTYSHIDCTDTVCAPRVFMKEIRECQRIARKYGVTMKTFVHPGHTIGNLNTLCKFGFRSFRTDYANVLDYPVKDDSGLWELKGTMEFVHRPEWSIDYHVHRYVRIIDRALASQRVCLFWFHPSVDPVFISKILPSIFGYVDNMRQMLWITTMQEYVDWLDRVRDA